MYILEISRFSGELKCLSVDFIMIVGFEDVVAHPMRMFVVLDMRNSLLIDSEI